MSSTKILSQRDIFQADLFKVVETTLEINGKIHVHKNIYRPEIVSVFPLTDKNEIVLIKQYRYLHNATFLEEVAGHVDPGEDIVDAAKRELVEEVGMSAGTLKKFGEFSGTSSVIKTAIHLYVATDLTEGTAKPEEDEDIAVVKMPLDNAVEAVIQGDIRNSIASLGILLLSRLKEKGAL